MQPRLTRNRKDGLLFGVCSGLGDYFQVDPVVVRAIFVLMTITSGFGIPAYLLLLLVMPAGPQKTTSKQMPDPATDAVSRAPQTPQVQYQQVANEPDMRPVEAGYTGKTIPFPPPQQMQNLETEMASDIPCQRRSPRSWRTLGYILVVVGTLLLLDQLGLLAGAFIFPLLLIGAGVLLMQRGRSRRRR